MSKVAIHCEPCLKELLQASKGACPLTGHAKPTTDTLSIKRSEIAKLGAVCPFGEGRDGDEGWM